MKDAIRGLINLKFWSGGICPKNLVKQAEQVTLQIADGVSNQAHAFAVCAAQEESSKGFIMQEIQCLF